MSSALESFLPRRLAAEIDRVGKVIPMSRSIWLSSLASSRLRRFPLAQREWAASL
jgi:hypothetical protein